MFGQGWPEGLVELGAGAVLDGVGVDGVGVVVVVDGVVVVLGVDWVDEVPVAELPDPLGAAAAPAMPATAPPVASAPTTMTALIVFALLIQTSCGRCWGLLTPTILRPTPKRGATSA
jgi:hypothetical protein